MSAVIALINRVLPVLGSSTMSYSEPENMLVTTGHTSIAGNTYFKGVRLSDRIFIVLDIGIGYAHTFLNGLKIYANHNDEKKLIASKTYNTVYYNDDRVRSDAKELVKDELTNELSKSGTEVDEEWLNGFVDSLVEDTFRNQIDNLKTIQLNKLLEK